MKTLSLLGLLFILLISCDKDSSEIHTDDLNLSKEYYTYEDRLQLKFSDIFSKAIKDSKELRNLIKNESLKQFDNDHDVLYQLVKDSKVEGVSLSEYLSKYSDEKNIIAEIESKLPLLTILVPELPDFNAGSWDIDSEVPKIAVLKSNGIVLMENLEDTFSEYPSYAIPTFPTLVIKKNERVKVSDSGLLKSSGNNGVSFDFIDQCFNPQNNENILKSSGLDESFFDPAIINAYNLGMEWHRDHIYYGLTNTTLKGEFRPNYSEYLTNFILEGDYSSWFDKISDQAGDPKQNDNLSIDQISSKEKCLQYFWTDGAFEFQVRVLINSKNGMGSTLTKYFSAKPNELIEVTEWETRYIGYPFKHNIYLPKKVINKYYNPNLELLAWDLENYGMAWKFSIYEIDSSQELTETAEISSVYAMNFNLESTVKKKVGLKFGGSNTETHKSSCVIKTKLESDDLGEAILSFNEPIIISKESSTNHYNTREITTGWCSFSIIPRKVY